MRDELLWIASLVGLPSCVLGGGPFVAYGERGWTGGLEGDAGNAETFRIDALSLVGSVELQVRFNGGWSLALASRVDLRAVHCEST